MNSVAASSNSKDRLIFWLKLVCGMKTIHAERLLAEFNITTMQQLLDIDRTQLYTFVETNMKPWAEHIRNAVNNRYTHSRYRQPSTEWGDFADEQFQPEIKHYKNSAKIYDLVRKRETQWAKIAEEYYKQNLTLINLLEDEKEKVQVVSAPYSALSNRIKAL